MALPPKKYSKRRTRARRGHHALESVATNTCTQCGAATLPHRACPACGYYKPGIKAVVHADLRTNK